MEMIAHIGITIANSLNLCINRHNPIIQAYVNIYSKSIRVNDLKTAIAPNIAVLKYAPSSNPVLRLSWNRSLHMIRLIPIESSKWMATIIRKYLNSP